MIITPSTGLPSILDRWITAVDRLGPTLSSYSTYNVNPIAQSLMMCREPVLASQLRRRGPVALCSLNLEERSRLLSKADPSLSPTLKHLLLGESLAMERMIGTEAPFHALVFGNINKGHIAEKILQREFHNQRGAVFILEPPSQDALSFFPPIASSALLERRLRPTEAAAGLQPPASPPTRYVSGSATRETLGSS